MSPIDVLWFAVAVQWCAGVVVVVNLVMSRLNQTETQRIGEY